MTEKFFKSNSADSTGYDHHGFDESPEQIYTRYMKALNLKESDIIHKNILDIGAGSAGFAKFVQDSELDTRVVSVDRNYPKDEKPRTDKEYVVAIAQQLPFADQSFDLIVSVHALPHIGAKSGLRDRQQRVLSRNDAIIECLRVLKIGGEMRFGGMPTDVSRIEGLEKVFADNALRIVDRIESEGLLVIQKV